ncbi:MAG: Trm112 family protein [Rubrivivax sp.]|jgi:uncharacterized protein YbaR (Trm112 family)
MDHRLIHLLVCPLCKGPLVLHRDDTQRPTALVCSADRLAYPVRDGIPLMLESEALPWQPPEPPAPGSALASGPEATAP